MNSKWLGPYRLIRLIRLGDTCQIWAAVDPSEDDQVAIKVLRPELRDNPQELALLKWEYEVGSKLHHKSIPCFKDFVTSAETSFSVLELFSELNLQMALRGGPQMIAYMVEKIILETAEALSYLHSQGFIHCDVKPGNILMNRNGDIRLIDFKFACKKRTGLSKLFAKIPKLRGTRAYMSPEQIRQQHLNERSDIYSLGCTIFEILTGQPPYASGAPNEILSQHLSAPIPSVSQANEDVTKDFDAVLTSMMAKAPKDRPASMHVVISAIKSTKIFNRPPRLPER
jgi:serine/threonine protein kinase